MNASARAFEPSAHALSRSNLISRGSLKLRPTHERPVIRPQSSSSVKMGSFSDRAQMVLRKPKWIRWVKGSAWPKDDEIKKEKTMDADISLDETNPGYQILKKMGWGGDRPLGKNGNGILFPITQDLDTRLAGDRRGLGYELPEEKELGEEMETEVKVVEVRGKYAIGRSGVGDVYIPNGALKHMWNVESYSMENGDSVLNFIGKNVMAVIVRKEGKYKWRMKQILKDH